MENYGNSKKHVKYKITSDKTGTAGYDNVNKNASSRKIWLENVVYSLNLHIYSPAFPHILLYIQKLPSSETEQYQVYICQAYKLYQFFPFPYVNHVNDYTLSYVHPAKDIFLTTGT